jgi:hypothetical protein
MIKKPAVIAVIVLLIGAAGFWAWKRSTATAAPP